MWLSLKSRIISLDKRSVVNHGLFGVAGRDNAKIYAKQTQVMGQGMNQLKQVIKRGFDYTGNQCFNDNTFMDLLGQMLDFDPSNRISPEEILEHPYLTGEQTK